MEGGIKVDWCHQKLLQCPVEQVAKGDPKTRIYQPFVNATHGVLQVQNLEPPAPETVEVTVLNGSNGQKIPFTLKCTDTVGLLKTHLQKHLSLSKMANLNFAYNGKEVSVRSSMADLRVKSCATFITFQKCTGG